jgi:hypothetical protein
MNTMERIRQARAIVRSYEASLRAAKDNVKEWRDHVKHAQVRLNSLLDDESAGVQDLPLGEPDDDDALNRRLDELSAEANGDPDPDADNEQDEPEHHAEPMEACGVASDLGPADFEDDDDGPLLPEGEREGWDLVTSRLSVKDEAEEAALAKIEADARTDKPKRRRKAKAQPGV